jgi:RNA polymerase sigma-70 factor (ECF subfamily)
MGEASRAAELASRHHGSLFRWAEALARWNREEAMEIVQQTYLEVLEGRANLAGADDPKAFLFGVARRVAASRRRRRSIWGRILRVDLAHQPAPEAPPDPENATAAEERSARVRKALAELEGRQLQMVTLVFVEGLTIEESAHVLGISLGTARTHYHRAKQRLARLLEEPDDAS